MTLRRAMSTQQQSPLFTLPPELRNKIYEMVFESGLDSINLVKEHRRSEFHAEVLYVDLDRATRPSSMLLRTCQKAHSESIGIFKSAVQAYFQKEFIIALQSAEQTPPNPYAIRTSDKYIARMRHFAFPFQSYDQWRMNLKLSVTEEGRWVLQAINQSVVPDATAYAIADAFFQRWFEEEQYALDWILPVPLNRHRLLSLISRFQRSANTLSSALRGL